jgi:hypothetical protein
MQPTIYSYDLVNSKRLECLTLRSNPRNFRFNHPMKSGQIFRIDNCRAVGYFVLRNILIVETSSRILGPPSTHDACAIIPRALGSIEFRLCSSSFQSRDVGELSHSGRGLFPWRSKGRDSIASVRRSPSCCALASSVNSPHPIERSFRFVLISLEPALGRALHRPQTHVPPMWRSTGRAPGDTRASRQKTLLLRMLQKPGLSKQRWVNTSRPPS